MRTPKRTLAKGRLLENDRILTLTDFSVDNKYAIQTGSWLNSAANDGYYGVDYIYSSLDDSSVKWQLNVKQTGNYSVFVMLPNGDSNRPIKAVYDIKHSNGIAKVSIDQRNRGGGLGVSRNLPFRGKRYKLCGN